MNTILLKNQTETEEFGRTLAEKLQPGAVIALTGDLGAGKTTLTKAIAKGLGVSETITSPTFTIVCEYDSGRLPFYHFDVYRIHDEDELFEIGFDDYLHGRGVCVVEWADLVPELLPENTLWLELAYGEGEDERVCTIK